MNPNISIIIINITGLNSEMKRLKTFRMGFKNPVKKKHLNAWELRKVESAERGKTIVGKIKTKNSEYTLLISDKTNIKANALWEIQKVIKDFTHQNDT